MFSRRWHALGRESELAAEMIAAGVTSLGRAGINRKSCYLTAFFQLSIGFERAGKIVYIANYVRTNQGRYPTNKELKAIGHDLARLFSTLSGFPSKSVYGGTLEFPDTAIHGEIVRVLSDFAQSARYYNLDFLSQQLQAQYFDPIQDWYMSVGRPILERHYSTRRADLGGEKAHSLSESLEGVSMIVSSKIDTTAIDDYFSLLLERNDDAYIQRWGRVYTLQIARWLTNLIYGCTANFPHGVDLEPFFGIEEPFAIFLNDDKYFREKKVWTIYNSG